MLRILTANLLGDRSSPLALARLLDETDPDVVAVQELAPSNAAVIRSRYQGGVLRPALGTDGMGLVARGPIDVHRIPLPRRSALAGRLQLPAEQPVHVWAAHLANPMDTPPPFWIRRTQVRILEEALEETWGPLVLVGDLNASPIWPAYRRLRAKLDDGVVQWAQREGTTPSRTWAYRPALPRLLRIDHALVRDVTVVDVRVLRVPGSDHRALVVDLFPDSPTSTNRDGPLSSR